MPCTTILVGKKASNNGATIIARNDDSPSGVFHVKKMTIVPSLENKKVYKSKISHVEIPLPDRGLKYTLMPNVDLKEGVWGAAGVNSENVAMSATETITSNPRVLGADPYVKFDEKSNEPGGIGEEDLVSLVLPYIHSAREGVNRLGSLLEKYGTYEPNGIAFSDNDEIWWLETIGGHHWMARRVGDNEVVVMPNQLGMDYFDFDDAYGKKENYLCSEDLLEFVKKFYLSLDESLEKFNPRLAFGSHDDSDHIYNTPRAWFMGRYFCPKNLKWEGECRDYGPEDNDIPFAFVPERKVTIEDVKYLLSSHYQGTEYDPYSKGDSAKKNMYRCIGVNRTSFLAIIEIRNDVPKAIAPIEWVCFASNVFNALIPLYTNVECLPKYLTNTTLDVSTDNFYWSSRLISALADAHFNKNAIHIERYQNECMEIGHRIINETDSRFIENSDMALLTDANEKVTDLIKKETLKCLNNVLYESSMLMKNSFARSDN